MDYETEISGKKVTLRVLGDLSLETVDRMRDKFLSIAKESRDSEITLFFPEKGTIDSAGIQLLILIYKASSASGSAFRIECPNKTVKEVLLVVGLDSMFKVA